eukprot:3856480-Amphidinium_carterae.1
METHTMKRFHDSRLHVRWQAKRTHPSHRLLKGFLQEAHCVSTPRSLVVSLTEGRPSISATGLVSRASSDVGDSAGTSSTRVVSDDTPELDHTRPPEFAPSF